MDFSTVITRVRVAVRVVVLDATCDAIRYKFFFIYIFYIFYFPGFVLSGRPKSGHVDHYAISHGIGLINYM